VESFNYKERRDRLGLFSLKENSLRGDLREDYKIMRGIDSVDRKDLSPWQTVKDQRSEV